MPCGVGPFRLAMLSPSVSGRKCFSYTPIACGIQSPSYGSFGGLKGARPFGSLQIGSSSRVQIFWPYFMVIVVFVFL